jgi:hypothetical protein
MIAKPALGGMSGHEIRQVAMQVPAAEALKVRPRTTKPERPSAPDDIRFL